MSTDKHVFVGLSGGVDSSVAALRLKRAGYRVTGVFIKVWQPDFLHCDWEAERLDAMRVAATLDIPFLTCDASERYKADVVDYLIQEYKEGRTPNPDVMCNKHVKFGAFLDFARAHGADYVATGHYAQMDDALHLIRGIDESKDQSYFLWTLTDDVRAHTLLPVGDSKKEGIREEARRAGLPTAQKPDSQGICFLGALDMKEFLGHFITPQRGPVLDEHGLTLGEHDGVSFYTVGQRHGFTITKNTTDERPYYITEKRIGDNTLVVSHEKPVFKANTSILKLHNTNWIGDLPVHGVVDIQVRYHQKPVRGTVTIEENNTATVTLDEPQEKTALGQSCVLYDGMRCLGGGIIVEA